MNQKSVLGLFFNNSKEKLSSGFIGIPILVMIIVAVTTLAVTVKSINDKSHVLGASTLIAQTPPQGQSAPQPQQPQQQPQSQPQQQQSQPQQPSQPQNQPPQSQQAPQNNQGSQPQQPNQNQQYLPNNQTGQTPQGNNQQWQQNGGQQYSSQQGGYNGNQPGSNQQGNYGQQGNNYSRQNGGYGQNNQGPQTGNTGNFLGTQGQPGVPQNQQGANNNPQTISAQDQQKYQQMQQQWQQQAANSGFKFQGNLPQQYLQQQNPSGNNNQSPNSQGGQNNQGNQLGPNQQGGNNENQTPQFNSNNFQALPSTNFFPTIQGNFNVNTTNGQGSVNLNDPNTRVMLGTYSLQAVKLDGTPIPIDKSALEKVATAIKLETGSDFSQKGNTFSLKRGQVQADTTLPLSFNVATKDFSIQVSGGEQTVKVLPDEAVQKLLDSKVLSQIQTNGTGQSGSTTPVVQLTELNNQAVYQVSGNNQKKVFGFIPVSIPKTVFISTSTGQQVSTNQSFFSNLLDKISQ